MRSGHASRTAILVCQGRAAADGRIAPGLFSDPIATQLLTSDEREPVTRAREGHMPSDGRERFLVESITACAQVVAPRTVLIDDALTAAVGALPDRQVVLLGAGLDARPWRLQTLLGVPVFSVDHPASQSDLRQRCTVLPPPVCDLRLVPIDLAGEPLAPALRAAGHDQSRPTVWVWEGVIPYLTRAQVLATVDSLTAVSAPGSQLIAQYQARSLATSLGRRLSGVVARASGADSVLADEPWRSMWRPATLARALSARRWTVDADESLLTAAQRIGSPTSRRRSLSSGRVLLAHS